MLITNYKRKQKRFFNCASEVVAEYDSIAEAARHMGVAPQSSSALRKGYIM